MTKQLHLPMDIPIAGESSRERIRKRIDDVKREGIPEGRIVRTKQISIKRYLKP